MNPSLFIQYKSLNMIALNLPPEDAGLFIRDMVNYIDTGNIDTEFGLYDEPLIAAAIWLQVKPDIDNSINRYKKFLSENKH